jgi:hypothetical protein
MGWAELRTTAGTRWKKGKKGTKGTKWKMKGTRVWWRSRPMDIGRRGGQQLHGN